MKYNWKDTPEIFANGAFGYVSPFTDRQYGFTPKRLAELIDAQMLRNVKLVARPTGDLTGDELDKVARIEGYPTFAAYKAAKERRRKLSMGEDAPSLQCDPYESILVWNLQYKSNYKFVRYALKIGLYPFCRDEENVIYQPKHEPQWG